MFKWFLIFVFTIVSLSSRSLWYWTLILTSRDHFTDFRTIPSPNYCLSLFYNASMRSGFSVFSPFLFRHRKAINFRFLTVGIYTCLVICLSVSICNPSCAPNLFCSFHYHLNFLSHLSVPCIYARSHASCPLFSSSTVLITNPDRDSENHPFHPVCYLFCTTIPWAPRDFVHGRLPTWPNGTAHIHLRLKQCTCSPPPLWHVTSLVTQPRARSGALCVCALDTETRPGNSLFDSPPCDKNSP